VNELDKMIKVIILLVVSGIFIISIIVLALMPGFFPLINSDWTFNFGNFLIIPFLALIIMIFVFIANYCIEEIIDLKRIQSKGSE